MKLNYIMIIIVVSLAVYVGINITDKDTIANNENSEVQHIFASTPVDNGNNQKYTKEEQQKEFTNFYQSIYKFIKDFEEIDKKTKSLAEQNPSRIQQNEFFSKVKIAMEEGQRLPLTRLIPEGFTETQTETMNNITSQLYDAFQYRKFGYEHYLEYIETGSPKTYSTSTEWINNGNESLRFAIINLEALMIELGFEEEKVD